MRRAVAAVERPVLHFDDANRRIGRVAERTLGLVRGEWARRSDLLRTDLVRPPASRAADAIDRGSFLLGSTKADAVQLSRDLQPSSWLASARRRSSALERSIGRAGTILGLDRQVLPDRSDWERRTDPDDLTPPASLGERLLRRLGF